MKLKTRLKVTFISIILLPLLLTVLAFMSIAIYLMNIQPGGQMAQLDYVTVSENIQDFINLTDKAYYTVLEQVEQDPSRLEDQEYLEWVNREIARKSTYIIVRKADELYYAGDKAGARSIFDKLPTYGKPQMAEDSGYYYNSLEKYVKQIDFTFRDGSEGSVFVITKLNPLISRKLLIDMLIILSHLLSIF